MAVRSTPAWASLQGQRVSPGPRSWALCTAHLHERPGCMCGCPAGSSQAGGRGPGRGQQAITTVWRAAAPEPPTRRRARRGTPRSGQWRRRRGMRRAATRGQGGVLPPGRQAGTRPPGHTRSRRKSCCWGLREKGRGRHFTNRCLCIVWQQQAAAEAELHGPSQAPARPTHRSSLPHPSSPSCQLWGKYVLLPAGQAPHLSRMRTARLRGQPSRPCVEITALCRPFRRSLVIKG